VREGPWKATTCCTKEIYRCESYDLDRTRLKALPSAQV
jgi:hypothetical protein